MTKQMPAVIVALCLLLIGVMVYQDHHKKPEYHRSNHTLLVAASLLSRLGN